MTTAPADHLAWRRLAVVPVLVLVAVAVLWNAAALAIDASPLEQRVDSWGLAFGSVLWTVVGGAVPLVLTFGLALAARFVAPATARRLAWGGAGVDGVCAVGLVLAAGVLVATEPPAGQVFAGVTLALALLLVVPLVLCARRSRRS